MHGSLLPKNPHFADFLIGLALQRTYGIDLAFSKSERVSDIEGEGDYALAEENGTGNGKVNANGAIAPETSVLDLSAMLTPLDDRLEWEAHAAMLERMGLQKAAVSALRNYQAK